MNNQIEEIELLGCPFCGSSPKFRLGKDNVNWISCGDSSCIYVTAKYYKKAEEAIKAWNTRTPSISYSDAVEKVANWMALVEKKTAEQYEMEKDRYIALARAAMAALAAMDITTLKESV